jgi:hypothetical protein
LRLTVLIDADNAKADGIKGLIAEIARLGEATVKDSQRGQVYTLDSLKKVKCVNLTPHLQAWSNSRRSRELCRALAIKKCGR